MSVNLTPGLLSSGAGLLAGMQPPTSILAVWTFHAVGGYRRRVGGLGSTPDYADKGKDSRDMERDDDTRTAPFPWPETWAIAPPTCPVCDGPTAADRHLDSARGPGWRCTAEPLHFWLVRLFPLRHCLAARPPRYPWYGQPLAERLAWLAAHSHPPRCATNSNALEVRP